MKKIVSFLFCVLMFSVVSAGAQTESVLWSFNPAAHQPGFPYYDSIAISGGNLFGAVTEGGAYSDGAAFLLVPNGKGGWTHSTPYSFPAMNDNQPIGALVLDKAGNVYGASAEGGTNNTGYVYKISPRSGGGFTETVLHDFAACCGPGADGQTPFAGLVVDSAGNLYGTTTAGGSKNYGVIYELSPPKTGNAWTETILHSFTSYTTEGGYPESNLTFDSAGNLYGTASQGGIVNDACPVGCGTIFRLTPAGTRSTLTVLHQFNGADGNYPRYSGVTLDSAGNLYGATESGGTTSTGAGTVWELVYSAATRAYTFQTLHSFANGADGSDVLAGVTLDAKGNIYGAVFEGGANGQGIAYELTKSGSDWQETILHTFGAGSDGGYPSGGVVLDSAGNVYGLTEGGGAYGQGTVYRIKP